MNWTGPTKRRGSPPRMRGKDQPLINDAKAWGITPAYAGKRGRLSRAYEMQGDHPRVCGEKRSGSSPASILWGSPPRMRGKERHTAYWNPLHRITPAYAGKSAERKLYVVYMRDHPRVCGEKNYKRILGRQHRGSPPRMRGKARRKPLQPLHSGITPAYAGKSSPSRW